MKRLLRRVPAIVSANRTLVGNITGTAGLRGVAVLISIVSMPAYLNYFADSAVLGTWFTVLSLLNFLSFFDFGVGNGLRNHVAEAVAQKGTAGARELISAGYHLAFSVVAVLAVAGYFTIQLVHWDGIFGLDGTTVSSGGLKTTLVIVLSTVCAQLFLKNAISVLYGLQRMIIAGFPPLVTASILLVYLLIGGTGDTEQDLLRLATIYLIATVVPLLAVHIVLFTVILPGGHPRLKTTREAIHKVGGLGLGFFSIQLALLVVNSTDQILVSTIFTSSDVVNYQVHLQVFTLITVVFRLLTQPFWSAVTAAHARNDKPWIVKAARTLYLIAAVGTLAGLMIVPLLSFIFDIWLGSGKITVVWWYALAFVLLTGVQLFMFAGTTIANGTGALRPQMLWMPVAAVLKIPLALLFSVVLDAWAAIVVAHAVALIPLVVVQTRVLLKGRFL